LLFSISESDFTLAEFPANSLAVFACSEIEYFASSLLQLFRLKKEGLREWLAIFSTS